MESFKKKVKNFSKKDLADKEKALYICSRLRRNWVPENTEKKSRVGDKIERFESFNFGKNIPSKIGEVHWFIELTARTFFERRMIQII